MKRPISGSKSESTPIEPLLRWAGGKRQLLGRLLEFVPSNVRERVYHEPFLGAGCLFFALQPKKAVLSDANRYLISCYEFVRDNWQQVHRYLQEHKKRTSKRYFYEIRQEYNLYNHGRVSAAQAARFIYLNKTCFNGIFRVNQREEFNVPYGWKEPPAIPGRDLLAKASLALKRATLRAQSYEKALEAASESDFIYLDPPYPPLNGTSYFTHYTKDRFDTKDQEKLATVVRTLDTRGCFFMMTNADIPLIRDLYEDFRIRSIPVVRFITCQVKRHAVSELVITNYGQAEAATKAASKKYTRPKWLNEKCQP